MAWPLTNLRTYVAGTTPTIRASDLNDIQTWIVNLFTGTKTVKSLQTDGTGAAASTAASGQIDASTGIISGRYIKGNGSAPTIAVNANLGGGATASIPAGTNSSGRITLVSGTGPSPSVGVQATVTFAHGGYAAAPNAVIIVAADADTAGLSSLLYVDKASITATTFDISKATAALADSTTHELLYVVVA